jgi:hypothetical protein
LLRSGLCLKLSEDKLNGGQKKRPGLDWMAVTFVEQVYKELSGEEKYNKAAEWLATEAKVIGLTLPIRLRH